MIKRIVLLTLLCSACTASLGEGPFNIVVKDSAVKYTEHVHSAAALLEELAGCHLFFFDGEADITIIGHAPRNPDWIAAAKKSAPVIEIYKDTADEFVLAHELLHLLGFEHVDDHTNLMHASKTDGEHNLNPEQLEQLQSYCSTAE